MTITRAHKVFFSLILLEAILVAFLGYFFPSRLAEGFSWMVLPPLHARFVASLYFFGVVFMLGCLAARNWEQVRLAIPLAVIWTGLLFIVSIYHWDNFDLDLLPVKVWLVAYFVDPLFGLWLIWQRRDGWTLVRSPLPTITQGYLFLQGGIFSVIALLLLLLPATMTKAWPWNLDTTLAQFYAGPLLAYGVGSLLFGWQGTWAQLRIAAPAMFIFSAAALIASVKHSSLFASDEIPDMLWLAGFVIATLIHALLTIRALQMDRS